MKHQRADWRFAESPLATRLRALQQKFQLVAAEEPIRARGEAALPEESSPNSNASTAASPPPTKRRKFRTVELLVASPSLSDHAINVPAIPEDVLAARRVINKVAKHSSDFRKWKDTKDMKVARGRFTEEEDIILRDRIEGLCELHGWNWDQAMRILVEHSSRQKKKVPEHSLWCDVAMALPDRHIESVIMHVQSSMYKWARRGKWSPAEDISLVRIVKESGEDWKRASRELQRFWRTCRDHYKDLEAKGDIERLTSLGQAQEEQDLPLLHQIMAKVNWTLEEDRALLKAIRDLTGIEYPLTNIPWQTIRRVMGSQRTAAQVRHRYLLTLLPRGGELTSFSAACRRTLLRYLLRVLEARPDINWLEIHWTNVLPFWPRERLPMVAMRMLRRQYRKQEWRDPGDNGMNFGNLHKDWWKGLVPQTAQYMQCGRHEESDKQRIEEYIAKLKALNARAEEASPPKASTEPAVPEASTEHIVPTAIGNFAVDSLPRDTDYQALLATLRKQQQALKQAEQVASSGEGHTLAWLKEDRLTFEDVTSIDPDFFQ